MPPKVYITVFLFLYGLKMAISTLSEQCYLGLSYCVDIGKRWWIRDEEVAVDKLFETKKQGTLESEDNDDDDDSLSSFDDNTNDDDEESSSEEETKSDIKPFIGITMRKPRNFDKELNSTF
jgi:hypothetical protein